VSGEGEKYGSVQNEIEYYKRRIEELAGESLRFDIAVSGLKHELRQRRKAFALLSELQKSIGAQTELLSLFDVCMQAINATLGMDRTVMLTPTGKPLQYRPEQWLGFRQKETESFADLILRFPVEISEDGGYLLVNRSTETTPETEAIRSAFQLPYFICLPIMVEKTAIALLLSGRLMEAKPFYPPLERGDVDTFQAITDLISATIRTRRLAVLKEMDRLKTEFFANISHEFRTPVTLTLGPLEQILKGKYGSIPGKIRSQLLMMERNQDRLLGLINQILDLAKLESGSIRLKIAPVPDINHYLESRISPFRPMSEKRNIHLKTSFDPNASGANLFIDRKQFDKVLFNLLSNAIKFTKKGHINVFTRIEEDTFFLGVEDTGVGIRQDQLPFIFDRFRQADGSESREYAGTGLGLSLVKEIVTQHGGEVTVQSRFGKGSMFQVSLPLGRSHLDPASVVELAEEDQTFVSELKNGQLIGENSTDEEDVERINSETESAFAAEKPVVLYVEDNADLRNYVLELLKASYNVFLAVDGKDGLAKARKFRPDLIITDQMMPHMSGRGLLREVRRDPELRATPIIFLTAKAGADTRIESLDAGADDYLLKPFNEIELCIRIRNLLKARAQEKELAELNRRLQGQISEQEAQVELAARIQSDLLPKIAPRLKDYEIAGKNIPAKQVGGDYFDFIPMDEHRIAVCVGDVCGKGLPASLLMANLQATIRGQVMYSATVGDCLEKSNKLLYRCTDKKTFVSLFLGILDTRTHTITYANAGQNLPILFPKSKKPYSLEKRGLVLGAVEKTTYEEENVVLKKGDLLLIYSDGINEAMNEKMEEFGDDRLRDIVFLHRDSTPAEIIGRILSAVEYFIRARAANDDMTLLVLKRN
jgi:serine phosphatase RsbU (regulator of sigma subunit)/signal transduction histidine kinase